MSTRDREERRRVQMEHVPDPLHDSRVSYIAEGGIQGAGDIDYVCSHCGEDVLKGMTESQGTALRAVAFSCPNCRAYMLARAPAR